MWDGVLRTPAHTCFYQATTTLCSATCLLLQIESSPRVLAHLEQSWCHSFHLWPRPCWSQGGGSLVVKVNVSLSSLSGRKTGQVHIRLSKGWKSVLDTSVICFVRIHLQLFEAESLDIQCCILWNHMTLMENISFGSTYQMKSRWSSCKFLCFLLPFQIGGPISHYWNCVEVLRFWCSTRVHIVCNMLTVREVSSWELIKLTDPGARSFRAAILT